MIITHYNSLVVEVSALSDGAYRSAQIYDEIPRLTIFGLRFAAESVLSVIPYVKTCIYSLLFILLAQDGGKQDEGTC